MQLLRRRVLAAAGAEALNGPVSVVVVGAGQAGWAISHQLDLAGVEHVVLERGRIAQAWRDRWDSFTLVTPNGTLDLPGSPYAGADPEGHIPRDEIVDYLERYATRQVHEGVDVRGVWRGPDAALRVETSDGPLEASAVVVCTGAYQKPHRPPAAAGFAHSTAVLDSTDYRNPDQLPAGRVLAVAEDLTTTVPGLYFCGVHFLRTRKSSLLFGVGTDAALVARTLISNLN